MKIQEQDVYHGTALTQIVKHESFKALNRASEKYGHYMVNTARHVFAKYRTKKRSPWQFPFHPADVLGIRQALDSSSFVFLCLVCGTQTICALNADEIQQVLDLKKGQGVQTITVDIPKGGSCHVHGSAGYLDKTVPHNSFPEKIFL